MADGHGRTVAFRIALGQAHELPRAAPLLDRLPGVPRWVVADRGYSSHAVRQYVWDAGGRPAGPTKRNEKPVARPDYIDNNRNVVDRLWAKPKEWRAVATRYGKTACPFMSVLLPRRSPRLARKLTRPGTRQNAQSGKRGPRVTPTGLPSPCLRSSWGLSGSSAQQWGGAGGGTDA